MYRPDGPVEMRPVGEIEFAQGLAAASASGLYGESRAAAAIVGHADLDLGERVEPVLDALLESVQVLSYSREDAHATAAVRAALRKAGRPIGPYDTMLAGCALARGLVFVTANTGEFNRVGGLQVEDWSA